MAEINSKTPKISKIWVQKKFTIFLFVQKNALKWPKSDSML